MGRGTMSSVAYTRVAERAKAAGSASHAGEQRRREGKGIHPLVDPSGYTVYRPSRSWYEPKGNLFELYRGVAMLVETRLDTTGSMGENVEVALRVLPVTHSLLQTGAGAVLGRYDVQMINGIFGDVQDSVVLYRSQSEIDERIADQLTYMVPERDGGDQTEDPQYGIFGGAYLTVSFANRYGLKYYDFTISDAPARDQLDVRTVYRVFGDKVFEKINEARKELGENEYGMEIGTVDKNHLPSTKECVDELKKRAHAFFLQVGDEPSVGGYWRRVYGNDNVVVIPTTEYLPFVQAAIIGLTEGTLDLQTVKDFIADGMAKAIETKSVKKQGTIKDEASKIVRAVSGIPIGAQMRAANFKNIPLKGAMFKERYDLWPIDADSSAPAAAKPPKRIKWS